MNNPKETIDSAFNPDCSACVQGRQHTKTEDKEFHPFTGQGYTPESGWTHPGIQQGRKGQEQVRIREKEKR